jgi:Fe-coproporphyrin III synthase
MTASASLMLHLTGQCNLECRHCYMEGSPRRREQLPVDWVQASLREAPRLGIGSVFLTGGEPLLHSRFGDIALAASAVDGLSTTVCTNATLVKQHDAQIFANYGFKVHVSIDGEPAFHDAFRAVEGAFRRAERGLSLLVRQGVDVTITTTISRANLEQFPRIAQWAFDVGAKRLLVQPLLELGRAVDIADQRLTSAQLNGLILLTSDLANSSSGRITASIIGGNKRFFLAHPCAAYVCNGGGCHRGVSAEIKKVVVREDGSILPEATNLDRSYRIGHVDEGSLGAQISRYFVDGYNRFDRLCRATYEEYVPDWPDAILPWDQLLAQRSRHALPTSEAGGAHGCGNKALGDASQRLHPGQACHASRRTTIPIVASA